MFRKFRKSSAALLGALLLAGCAQAPTAGPSQVSGGAAAAPAAGAPKTLTVAVQTEPSGLNPYLTTGLTAGGAAQVYLIAHNYLVVTADDDSLVPQLAQSIISTEDGSWRVNPDGTMDTTWHLRPNERWQDGVPFTSDDLLFAFQVYKDPDVPSQAGVLLGSG